MLDASALSQLSSLKNRFQEDKVLLTGLVTGTSGRFGFVVTEDGDRHFLPPDEMKRVLPGDRIEFSVVEQGDRTQAKVENLLDTPLTHFVGKVVSRKNRRFVIADAPGLQRWFTLTRKSAEECSEGQWVRCDVRKHPFEDGKALAIATDVLGDDSTPFLEHHIARARFDVRTDFPSEVLDQAEALQAETRPPETTDYEDATDLALVTIDAASTRDMDDAILVTPSERGWHVTVAIADPTAWVPTGSPIDREAFNRFSSRYLPGETIHMLPPRLAEDLCALRPGVERPAMLISTEVSAETGVPETPDFRFGFVRSRAKLSYKDVADFFAGNTPPDAIREAGVENELTHLHSLTDRLMAYRNTHHMVMPERPDFRLRLNERGHIDRIEEQTRNKAQQAVEEVMLLSNRLAADWLTELASGLFLQHAGFRPDQHDRVRDILQTGLQDAGDNRELPADITDFATMLPLLQGIDEQTGRPLSQIVTRFYQKAELAVEPAPHWGLGFNAYTTVTSPIRKYLDLFLHRQIKALWRGQTPPELTADELAHLRDEQTLARAVGNFTEQWLKLIFLQGQTGKTFTGTVQNVTPNGFSVQLDGLGTNGFVSLRSLNDDSAEFDPARLSHHMSRGTVTFGQAVTVRLDAVDQERQALQLSWLP